MYENMFKSIFMKTKAFLAKIMLNPSIFFHLIFSKMYNFYTCKNKAFSTFFTKIYVHSIHSLYSAYTDKYRASPKVRISEIFCVYYSIYSMAFSAFAEQQTCNFWHTFVTKYFSHFFTRSAFFSNILYVFDSCDYDQNIQMNVVFIGKSSVHAPFNQPRWSSMCRSSLALPYYKDSETGTFILRFQTLFD